MGTVISLANQKGGVAKTTTSANLGAGLALHGQKTLLIDFDPQGSLTQFFGVDKQPDFKTVGDWVLDRKPFNEVVQKTPFERLDIVPAGEQLKSDELDMEKDRLRALKFLQRKVEQIQDQYDFILIDTLPSFSLLFLNSLVAADYVLVPTKLEFLSMRGLTLLFSRVRDIQQEVKPIKILGVVGTFYRTGVKESEACLAELKQTLPNHVLAAVIHLNSKLSESASYAKPIQHYDRSSQGYLDYENLTKEVLEKCRVKQPLVAAH